MAKSLRGLVKLVESANNSLPVEKSFVTDLNYTIEKEDSKGTRAPSKTFKPSSIGGCKRNIYFQITGEEPESDRSSSNLVGICESGTDRHIRIQTAICKMKDNGIDCEYVDVSKFVEQRGLTDIEIVSKDGIETKCYNKKYNISFLTDGIIRYRGKYYILEIKTEMAHKFWEHNDTRPEHKAQGVMYYLSFGIADVIYLYENRDTLDKKAFHFVATPEMADEIVNIMNIVNEAAKGKEVPPKEEDKHKCVYCKYKKACAKYE